MGALRLSWLFFKVGVLNELQYRVNFVVQLFQSLISLVVGLVVLALVYSHTSELNGWTKSQLLCVLGIQILVPFGPSAGNFKKSHIELPVRVLKRCLTGIYH